MASAPYLRTSHLATLVVYSPEATTGLRASQLAALAVYSLAGAAPVKASQLAALVVWGEGTADTSRSRAWTFVLDGHTFYVLDLFNEGTFLYDTETKQWCQFTTSGHANWNMHNGTMWGEGRIAGGDAQTGTVWELSPDLATDEGYRQLVHTATGALVTRSRAYKSVDAFRLAASSGQLGSPTEATISLRWSDDQGKTWTARQAITLTDAAFGQEIAWRSLGSFKAPGRIFEVRDTGGVIRIDGADAGIAGFDEDESG